MKNNNKKFRSFVLWTSVVLLLIVGLLFVLKMTGGEGGSADNTLKKLSSEQMIISPDDHVRGNRSAKVVIIEYSDLACPACSGVESYLAKLSGEYTDRLAIVYRHFPLPTHKNAIVAAIASEAASRQGRFWEMADKLFKEQDTWNAESDPATTFVDFASSLGLDASRFANDLRDSDLRKRVENSQRQALDLKLSHTPTFFLNGRELPITQSYDEIKQAVDQALAQN